MREIKFRGFNRKNNVWLHGFYLQNRGAHFVCPDEWATGKSWDDYEIDPDTLGQLIDRKDKKDNDIYDGDIIRLDVCGDGSHGVVVYDAEHAMFALRYDDPHNPVIYGLYDCQQNELEVIGNIHDNPELLKK